MGDSKKFIYIAVLVIVAVGADQVTKLWASDRLANPVDHPRLIDGPHSFDLVVPPSAAGQPLSEFLRADLQGTPDDDIQDIARRWTYLNGTRPTGPDHKLQGGELLAISNREIRVPASAAGQPLNDVLATHLKGSPQEEALDVAWHWTLINPTRPAGPDHKLQGGETVTIRNRQIEVLPDYFHFRYTRNPGAAFSFLADAGESVRRPFFIIVSLIAVIVILVIMHRTPSSQRILLFALALIVGGAIGNLIDRFAYGWVIDFIDWHYRRDYTWPTFNIADACISVGIVLMALDMLKKTFAPQSDAAPASDAAKAPPDVAT